MRTRRTSRSDPVRNHQRSLSASKRSAYARRTAGESWSGSTENDTKRKSAAPENFFCRWLMREVIMGQGPVQRVKMNPATQTRPRRSADPTSRPLRSVSRNRGAGNVVCLSTWARRCASRINGTATPAVTAVRRAKKTQRWSVSDRPTAGLRGYPRGSRFRRTKTVANPSMAAAKTKVTEKQTTNDGPWVAPSNPRCKAMTP